MNKINIAANIKYLLEYEYRFIRLWNVIYRICHKSQHDTKIDDADFITH